MKGREGGGEGGEMKENLRTELSESSLRRRLKETVQSLNKMFNPFSGNVIR
jgi:hypothetical protein